MCSNDRIGKELIFIIAVVFYPSCWVLVANENLWNLGNHHLVVVAVYLWMNESGIFFIPGTEAEWLGQWDVGHDQGPSKNWVFVSDYHSTGHYCPSVRSNYDSVRS